MEKKKQKQKQIYFAFCWNFELKQTNTPFIEKGHFKEKMIIFFLYPFKTIPKEKGPMKRNDIALKHMLKITLEHTYIYIYIFIYFFIFLFNLIVFLKPPFIFPTSYFNFFWVFYLYCFYK